MKYLVPFLLGVLLAGCSSQPVISRKKPIPRSVYRKAQIEKCIFRFINVEVDAEKAYNICRGIYGRRKN